MLLLLLRLLLMLLLLCRVARLRKLVPRHWTSLGLLNARAREVHVRIPHPLPVQLLLRPQQLPQADRQLALAALGVLSSQNGGVKLRRHLLPVIKDTYRGYLNCLGCIIEILEKR